MRLTKTKHLTETFDNVSVNLSYLFTISVLYNVAFALAVVIRAALESLLCSRRVFIDAINRHDLGAAVDNYRDGLHGDVELTTTMMPVCVVAALKLHDIKMLDL